MISQSTFQSLVKVILSSGEFDTASSRHAILLSSGLPKAVMMSVNFEGPPQTFAVRVADLLVRFGRVSNGQLAIDLFLQHLEEDVGINKQVDIQKLRQKIADELQPPSLNSLTDIITALSNAFSLSEIRELMFEIGVDPEDISGDSKLSVIRNFVAYVTRRDLSEQLLNLVQGLRPGLGNRLVEEAESSIGADQENDGISLDLELIKVGIDIPSSVPVHEFLRLIGQRLRDFELLYLLLVLLYAEPIENALLKIRAFLRFADINDNSTNASNEITFLRIAISDPEFVLRVRTVSYASPASIDLLGIGKIFEVIRDTVKDVLWRGKHEKEQAELERGNSKLDAERKTIDNKLALLEVEQRKAELQAKYIEVAEKQLGLLNSLNDSRLSNDQRSIVIGAIATQIKQLSTPGDFQVIQ